MKKQTVSAVPSRNNTVISEEQVVKIEPIFARPNQLAKIYAISPSTISNYIKEIEASNDFSYLVKRPSPSIVIVEIKGFKDFLTARQKKNFHKINH